eukprot:scaffold261394_cov45-Tisochrysis_lutea.AAC.2
MGTQYSSYININMATKGWKNSGKRLVTFFLTSTTFMETRQARGYGAYCTINHNNVSMLYV